MKMYIDMIAFYLQKAGGVTNVWKELITRMIHDNRQIILILQEGECDNIYFDQIMSLNPSVIYEKRLYIGINRYLPVKCRMEKDSGFISTYYRIVSNKTVKQYTLVHDFVYEYYAKGLRKWVHSFQKKTSIKHADTIFCVSKNTLKDLIRFYPWAESGNHYVIYNGVSKEYRKIDEEIIVDELGEYNNKNFLLYIGSRSKYKRFDFAVEVANHFGYDVVIIGGGNLNAKESKLLHNALKGKYIHIKNIENDTLNKIYNKAFALIYPSEYEGFGIPVIEAQRAGCPVIAKKGSSINEVFGNVDNLMQDNTLTEAGRIIDMLKNNDKREKICSQGYINSKRFDWDRTYIKLKEIIDRGNIIGERSKIFG